jgi:hypothetical protein
MAPFAHDRWRIIAQQHNGSPSGRQTGARALVRRLAACSQDDIDFNLTLNDGLEDG